MKRTMFLIPMTFLLIVGCMAPKIFVNGAPANSNLLMARNEQLSIFAHAHRHYMKREGAETMMVYESIVFEDIVKLPADTLVVSVVLRVVNENKEPYQLWETYVLTDYNGDKTYRINKLYGGKLSMKEFNLQVPIRGATKGKYALKVTNMDSKVLFVVGTVRYKWKGVQLVD